MRPLIGIVGRRATKSSVLRYSGTIAAEALLDAVLAGGEPVILHGGGPGDLAGCPRGWPGSTASCCRRRRPEPGAVLGDPVAGLRAPRRPAGRVRPGGDQGGDRHRDADAGDLPGAAGAQRGLRRHAAAAHRGRPGRARGRAAPGDPRRRVAAAAAGGRGRCRGVVRPSPVGRPAGAGLHAVGCAPDGCLEAIEHTSAGILAVQWHPEDQAATRGYDQAIFDDLLIRARDRATVAAW